MKYYEDEISYLQEAIEKSASEYLTEGFDPSNIIFTNEDIIELRKLAYAKGAVWALKNYQELFNATK